PALYALSLHDALPILATAMVPAANFSHSETPIGPFQTTVPAFLMAAANFSRVLGPMSRPIQSSGMESEGTILDSALASYLTTGRSEEHTSELQSRFEL